MPPEHLKKSIPAQPEKQEKLMSDTFTIEDTEAVLGKISEDPTTKAYATARFEEWLGKNASPAMLKKFEEHKKEAKFEHVYVEYVTQELVAQILEKDYPQTKETAEAIQDLRAGKVKDEDLIRFVEEEHLQAKILERSLAIVESAPQGDPKKLQEHADFLKNARKVKIDAITERARQKREKLRWKKQETEA